MKEISARLKTHDVQAILAGRKTMMREVVKVSYQPVRDEIINGLRMLKPAGWPLLQESEFKDKFCPFGQPGDLIWVRETWQWDWKDLAKRDEKYYYFRATAGDEYLAYGEKWKPSTHMPKEAARIWLKVTDIKVERLQDISEEDAVREGVWLDDSVYPAGYTVYGMPHWATAKDCFEQLWKQINGPESWNSSPWVWALSFEVISTTGYDHIPLASGEVGKI